MKLIFVFATPSFAPVLVFVPVVDMADSAPPPPPVLVESESMCPPPPPPPEDEESPAASTVLDWKQQLVNLSASFLTLDNRTKKGLDVRDSVVVTASKLDKVFSLTDKKGDTHYIAATKAEQRQQWMDSLLEHGATVIRLPAKMVSCFCCCCCWCRFYYY